jgi:hypothetical protein
LEEEEGTVRQNYYVRVPLEHPDSHRWRAEIAKYLAPLVLGSTYDSLPHCDLNALRLPRATPLIQSFRDYVPHHLR